MPEIEIINARLRVRPEVFRSLALINQFNFLFVIYIRLIGEQRCIFSIIYYIWAKSGISSRTIISDYQPAIIHNCSSLAPKPARRQGYLVTWSRLRKVFNMLVWIYHFSAATHT